MTSKQVDSLNAVIEENLETTKKSKLPFFWCERSDSLRSPLLIDVPLTSDIYFFLAFVRISMVNSYDLFYLAYLLLIRTTLAPQSEALSAEVVVLNEVRHHLIDRRDIYCQMTYQPPGIYITISPLCFFCFSLFSREGRTFAEAPIEPIIYLTIDLLDAVKLPPRGILRLETCWA